MFICLEDAQLTKYECKTKKTSHKPRDVSVIKILTFHSKAIEMLFFSCHSVFYLCQMPLRVTR